MRLWKSSLSKRMSLKVCWNVWRMRSVLRMNFVRNTVGREWGNGWTIRRPASCWVSPPVPCRPSVRTARWRTARSVIKSITGRRTYGEYSPSFKKERRDGHERSADREKRDHSFSFPET